MIAKRLCRVLALSSVLGACGGIEWDLVTDDVDTSVTSRKETTARDINTYVPRCGDGLCEITETIDTCETDCSFCGDGRCSPGEDLQQCPEDCDEGGVDASDAGQDDTVDASDTTDDPEPPPIPFCGDEVCDGTEDETSCPADCPPNAPQPDPAQDVIGYVDHITIQNGEWVVVGWACHVGWAPSVEVEVYAGGNSATGIFLLRGLADAPQESAVGEACGVAVGQHRFRLTFSQEQLAEFAGQPIFVHAVSPVGNENRELVHSGTHSLPAAGTGSGASLPVDLNDVTWLHTNVSQWPVTTNLTVTFQGGVICLDYDKKDVWPPVAIPHNSGAYDIDVVANPWVFLEYQGAWYSGTWEWLVPGSTCKNMSSVAGDHIKQPAHLPLDWLPTSGQRLYFMVSGLARFGNIANTQERSQIVEVIWP